jgi:hypothetical protein
MQTHTNAVSIEEVAQQFSLWRQTKTSRSCRTPDSLKILVKQLAAHFTAAQIMNKVKIGRTLLKSLLQENNTIAQQNVDFIPFKINSNANRLNSNVSGYNTNNMSVITDFKHGQSICHIIKPNGSKLVIETTDPKSIIQTFLCYN